MKDETKFNYKTIKLNNVLTDLTKERKIIIDEKIEYKELTISSKTNKIKIRKQELGDKFKIKKRTQILKDDLVISRMHTQNGLYGLAEDNFIATTTFIPLKINADIINENFLFVLLKPTLKRLRKDDSVGRETYKTQEILNLKIPLPPLYEQEKLLNAYNEKIKLAKEQEQKYEKLQKSIEEYLIEELGIILPIKEEKKYGELQFVEFEKISRWGIAYLLNSTTPDKLFISSKYPNKSITDYVYVNPITNFDAVINNKISFLPMKCISDKYGEVIKYYEGKKENSKGYTKFIEGDLLWSKITPCMQNGKSVIVKNLQSGVGYGSTEYHVLRKKNNTINLDYVYHLLRTEYIRKQGTYHFTGSAGQQRVPVEFLNELQIPIPPLAKQTEIANHINNIKSEIKRLKTESELNRKTAILEFENKLFIK